MAFHFLRSSGEPCLVIVVGLAALDGNLADNITLTLILHKPTKTEDNTSTRRMSSHRRSENTSDDAAQPLYRDSNEDSEKPSQTENENQTRALQASVRRLRRWLIAVSVGLGLASVYILFSNRNVIRDHKGSRSFAPESQ